MLIVFSPLIEGGTTHHAVMIIRLIIIALLAVWLWIAVHSGVASIPFHSTYVLVWSFLALAAHSVMLSPYKHQSIQWLVVLASYALLLHMFVFYIFEWEQLRKLASVLIIMGVVEAGITVAQAAEGRVRPSGSFFNPNFLASYLAVIGTVVLGRVCYSIRPSGNRRISTRGILEWLVPSAVLVLLLGGIALSASRGVLFALALGAAVVLTIRFGRAAGLVILLAAVCFVAIPNPIRDRFYTEHVWNPVSYGRLQIWDSTIRAIKNNPLGVGAGLYQYVYPQYATPIEGLIARYGRVAQTAHNEYLQIALELGLLGLGVFLVGIAFALREAALLLRQRLRRWQRGLVVGVVGGIVVTLAHAVVDSNLHEPALAIVLTMLVGTILAGRSLGNRPAAKVITIPVGARVLWAVSGVATLILASLLSIKLGIAWMHYESGIKAQARSDYGAAIEYYEAAIALDEDKALYHSALGSVQFKIFQTTHQLEAIEASLRELKTAIELNPLDGRLFGLLGHVYRSWASRTGTIPSLRHSLLDASAQAFQQAIALRPFVPMHRMELAQIWLAVGKLEEAEAVVSEAVKLEPNFLPGREFLAYLYLKKNMFREAFHEYQEIIERRQRYSSQGQDQFDQSYLAVDVTRLKTALDQQRLAI